MDLQIEQLVFKVVRKITAVEKKWGEFEHTDNGRWMGRTQSNERRENKESGIEYKGKLDDNASSLPLLFDRVQWGTNLLRGTQPD